MNEVQDVVVREITISKGWYKAGYDGHVKLSAKEITGREIEVRINFSQEEILHILGLLQSKLIVPEDKILLCVTNTMNAIRDEIAKGKEQE